MRTAPIRNVLALVLVLYAVPLAASAHATPVAYVPEPSAVLATSTDSVTIRFSERVDAAASSIRITGPSGMSRAEDPRPDAQDPRSLSVSLTDDGSGVYQVTWSVVSSDDGHFTKGAYAFAVGAGQVVEASEATADVVEITTGPEAFGMTVELLGNGILWATLALFLFAVRPLLRAGKYEREARTIRNGYYAFLLAGIVLALVGGAIQLGVKTGDLAQLHGSGFFEALPMYLATAAGSATAYRMLCVIGVLALFAYARAKIARAIRVTPYEIAMLVLLCAFAFFRAKISHATANPFYPDLSILINFFHLIEKDIWAGIVGILALCALTPRLRSFLEELLPKAFAMLAIDLAAVSVTACYIVWLHLKSFGNLFTTQWGSAFLQLLLAAVLLAGARLYHVLARRYRPRLFARALPLSLAAEFAFALLVIYASSVVIITSPPLGQAPAASYSARDQGVVLTLERDRNEDGMFLLTTSARGAPPPVVTVRAGEAEPASLALEKRFDGGYIFPTAFLSGDGPYEVEITAPQTDGYDAHATFEVQGQDPVPASEAGASRAFDSLALVMIAIGVAALLLSIGVFWLSGRPAAAVPVPAQPFMPAAAALVFLLCASAGGYAMTALTASGLSNPFKAQCAADGNMWHLMMPTKAGMAVSLTPREGCMWGMGNYLYMFPDRREYDYYRTLPQATVTLDYPPVIAAGQPVLLSFSIKEPDGSPATLFIDMEKRVHMVIVSEDQTVFAHVHPDDAASLTRQEIDTSSFSRTYTFPKAGKYLISIDYAHGLTLEARQFVVNVAGTPAQREAAAQYPDSGTFGGYDVALDANLPMAGQVTTMVYKITKDGRPVTDLVPYLGAAMHVSVVKDDLSSFVHVHGEIHPPGTVLPPVIVKDGRVAHSMASMYVPPAFGTPIEAHLIFPTAGRYTVWGEFKVGDTVIPTSFTVQVQ